MTLSLFGMKINVTCTTWLKCDFKKLAHFLWNIGFLLIETRCNKQLQPETQWNTVVGMRREWSLTRFVLCSRRIGQGVVTAFKQFTLRRHQHFGHNKRPDLISASTLNLLPKSNTRTLNGLSISARQSPNLSCWDLQINLFFIYNSAWLCWVLSYSFLHLAGLFTFNKLLCSTKVGNGYIAWHWIANVGLDYGFSVSCYK